MESDIKTAIKGILTEDEQAEFEAICTGILKNTNLTDKDIAAVSMLTTFFIKAIVAVEVLK